MDRRLSAAREHRTVTRVVRILEQVAASTPEPVRLAEVSEALAAPKTSAHGLVKGLVATGYLRESSGGYVIGPAVSTLLGVVESPVGLSVRPILEKLRALFDETVILSARVGSSVVYLDMVESSQFIRYAAPLRQRRPIYPTSTGKCFLAAMPMRQCEALLAEFIGDPAKLNEVRAELERARAEGVAFNRGETVPDVSAAASLVAVRDGSPIALAVVGPTTRVEQRLPEIAAAVRAAAEELAAASRRVRATADPTGLSHRSV